METPPDWLVNGQKWGYSTGRQSADGAFGCGGLKAGREKGKSCFDSLFASFNITFSPDHLEMETGRLVFFGDGFFVCLKKKEEEEEKKHSIMDGWMEAHACTSLLSDTR